MVKRWQGEGIELRISKILFALWLSPWDIMSRNWQQFWLLSLCTNLFRDRPLLKLLSKRIEALDQFIVKHRKDYVDLHRTTKQEQDNIEHEVSVFIKACKDQIDILKNKTSDDEKNGNSRAWLGMRDDNSHADVVAHKHGVVLILSERLHSVTAQFDRLRSMRFQDAVNRSVTRRKLNIIADSKPSDVSDSNGQELREHQFSSVPSMIPEQQLLDDETQALQVELTNLLDAVQETETKMVEMSALNHLMSTHVLQQAQQIEQLYDQSINGGESSKSRTPNAYRHSCGNGRVPDHISPSHRDTLASNCSPCIAEREPIIPIPDRLRVVNFIVDLRLADPKKQFCHLLIYWLRQAPRVVDAEVPNTAPFPTLQQSSALVNQVCRSEAIQPRGVPERKGAALSHTVAGAGSESVPHHKNISPHSGVRDLRFYFPKISMPQAVEATKNVEGGNKELSQAIQRNSSSRTFLLLFLFVLTFSVLFLDWYN